MYCRNKVDKERIQDATSGHSSFAASWAGDISSSYKL